MSILGKQISQRMGKTGIIFQFMAPLVCCIGWRLFHMRPKTVVGNDEHLAIGQEAIAYGFVARRVADLLAAHEACLYLDKHPIKISPVSH